ncbi:hypothetical protein HPB50_013348 [Hyalomma asiaticum]|uniref:Uncharacterized protein n=1 Tax=Hyalomma asiaticum TaxID=266040 RepID=A0ACB7SB94_HYAAI|nr:hypothetical protein HPB50_013348 [Hyalomma asiaticum]
MQRSDDTMDSAMTVMVMEVGLPPLDWVSKCGEHSRSTITITLAFLPAHTAAASQLDTRFKARHNVCATVVCGEAAYAGHKGATEWQNGLLPAALANYTMENVFNLDDSALFYRLLPNRTLAFKGENCTGGKHAKERQSAAFAVNATGSQKLPLLFIGQFAKLRILLAVECGMAYCIDMLGAIHPLTYSWQQVESTTPLNCFARAKFVVRVNTGESKECADECDSLLTEVLEHQASAKALHFESFHDLGSDMATSPDLTDSKIVAAVVPREVEDDEHDDDDIEADPSPSLMAVADAMAVMRAFAEKKGLMARLARSLSEFNDAVVTARLPRRQLTLTDFWSTTSE